MGPGWDRHHGRASGSVADSTGGILITCLNYLDHCETPLHLELDSHCLDY